MQNSMNYCSDSTNSKISSSYVRRSAVIISQLSQIFECSMGGSYNTGSIIHSACFAPLIEGIVFARVWCRMV